MAKSKGQSLHLPDDAVLSTMIQDSLRKSASDTTATAADGHNVDGWTKEDIQTYNELLQERAKLEKEKNDLEKKSSRQQAQRALLDENALALDTLFVGHAGGIQKFIGPHSCCLDENPKTARHEASGNACPSGHEICRRAKTKGISSLELDTIKYYQSRIRSERSERMQKALRKQRDVELIRVKKDDGGQTLKERKNMLHDRSLRNTNRSPAEQIDAVRSSSLSDILAPKDIFSDPKKNAILEAARENESIVRQIRERLDKIRHDVNAGKVSPSNARAKLDQANSEMADAEKKNNEFRKLILDVDPAIPHLHQSHHTNLSTLLQNTMQSASSDAFSQALSAMKGFFSASDPNDVQTAMTELRSVLEINGPMTPVLQKSFGALEEMLSKPEAKSFALDLKTDLGKIDTCSNVVDVMLNLRSKMEASDLSSAAVDPTLNLDQDTIKANLECVKVEDAAKKEMMKTMQRMANESPESISAALKKIKGKAVLKSPIPPLSDIILDDIINGLLFHRMVSAFVTQTAAITSVNELSGKITSLVIATARNRPEKYLSTLDVFKKSVHNILKNDHPETLMHAISKVEVSMKKFVAAHDAKRKKNMVENASMPSSTSNSIASHSMLEVGFLLSGTRLSKDSWEAFEAFFNQPNSKDRNELRNHVLDYVYNHVEEGIWDVFRVVTARLISQKFRPGPWNEAKKLCLANMRVAATTPKEDLEDTIVRYKHIGTCPGMAAIIIAQRLCYLMRADPERYGNGMIDLGSSATLRAAAERDHWIACFRALMEAMIGLYSVMYHRIAVDDDLAAVIVSIDVVGLVMTFVFDVEDSAQALFNLGVLEAFITRTLVDDSDPQAVGGLKSVLSRFERMCQKPHYRCSPSHACRGRVNGLNARNMKPIPKPLPRFGKENQMMRLGTMDEIHSVTGTSNQDFPRGIKLSLLVDSDWDIARKLLPHLKCIDRRDVDWKCECPKQDRDRALEVARLKTQLNRDFAELNVFLKSGKAPPNVLWERIESNEVKFHDLPILYSDRPERAHQDTANLVQMVQQKLDEKNRPTRTVDGSSTSPGQARMDQVSVNMPDIQQRAVDSSSDPIDLEEGSPETSGGKQIDSQATSKTSTARSASPTIASSSSVPPPPAPVVAANEHSPLDFAEAETELVLNVTRLIEGMPLLNTTNSALPGVLDPNMFLGVKKQLDTLILGHLEAALQVAELQGYHGAKLWLLHNISWGGHLTKFKGCEPCNTSMRLALETAIKENGWDRLDRPRHEEVAERVGLPNERLATATPSETASSSYTAGGQRRRRPKRAR
ncbi:hypothetical protein PV08_06020 [Exophiala spinifera]|uniref:Uncharacterized protein n=1 Tax=Exophiala spinifera TaxID=91928 RepID=A0A0D2BBK6_9EURO|nr:uncharacterized protein PV08_06020 [Exophiala spinifera]KIW15970.1 hypothetical protein PV08_06020 [Exophiala spinifera]